MMIKSRLFYILLSLSLIVYITMPFSNDVLVNFGAAFQADHFGDFPQNVYQSWDLRGIGNKSVFYLIKEAVSIICAPTHTMAFNLITKCLYLALFFGLCFGSIRSLRPWLERYKIDEPLLKLCLFVSVISAPALFLQAELTAIPLTFVMLALAYSSKKYLNYLSGILLILLFSLKGVTVLYGGFVLLALLFTFKERPELLVRAIVSGAFFLVAGILFYIYVIPLELLDLKNATLYQDSFSRTLHHFIGRIVIRTPEYYVYRILAIPALGTGLFLGLTALKSRNKTRSLRHILFISGLISIPYLYVFLQNKFFLYHYAPFIIPCSLVLFFWNPQKSLTWTLALGLFASSVTIDAMDHTGFLYRYARATSLIETGKEIQRIIGDDAPILYLHDGTINFQVHNKSYIREFYPLPIQRSQSYWRVKETDNYTQTLNTVKQFDGPYIVVKNKWFRLDLHGLEDKLNTEYEPINVLDQTHTLLFKKREI